MKLWLNFADSEVASVTNSAAGVVIRFSAAHVEQVPAAPDEKPVVGFSRGVSLVLAAATLANELGSLVGRVSHGRVAIASQWSSTIPLPLVETGPVILQLAFSNQSQLSLAAEGLGCRFDGDANFTESLAC